MRPTCLAFAFAPMLLLSIAARAELPSAALVTERDRAVQCLASAISYEAGNEPIAGQEAVAQVILNRLRHPAYPKTVCGVVYQGSTRKTGCQFTFTCDGSLSRPRPASSLSKSALIAERALSGFMSASVGGATHYHADYVTPYWASSLIKVATIGAHLFYRMPGAPDSPAYIVPGAKVAEPAIVARIGEGAAVPPLGQSNARATTNVFSPWGLSLAASPASR